MCRGNQMNLTQQQVALVLPGGPFTRADLAAVVAEASAAAVDSSLCKLAWEVGHRVSCGTIPRKHVKAVSALMQAHASKTGISYHCTVVMTLPGICCCCQTLQVSDTGAVYSAQQMAELLFGGVPNAARCAAAHAMLSADRTFFKQTARLPPAFQPRSAAAVDAICAEEAAALQVLPLCSASDRKQVVNLLCASSLPHCIMPTVTMPSC